MSELVPVADSPPHGGPGSTRELADVRRNIDVGTPLAAASSALPQTRTSAALRAVAHHVEGAMHRRAQPSVAVSINDQTAERAAGSVRTARLPLSPDAVGPDANGRDANEPSAVGSVTVPRVRSWQPWQLHLAAVSLHDLFTVQAFASLAWTGTTPYTATDHSTQHDVPSVVLANLVADMALALSQAAQTLATVRDDVLLAVQSARADGCVVSDTGDVSPVTLPPVESAGVRQPGFQTAHFVLQEQGGSEMTKGQRHGRAIQTALAIADAADEAVAACLRLVCCP